VDINVLLNDVPGDGALDPTSVSFVSGTEPNPTTEGVFTVNSTTGLVTFTPAADYTGVVTIDYEVCDVNSLCDEATITVTINPGGGGDEQLTILARPRAGCPFSTASRENMTGSWMCL